MGGSDVAESDFRVNRPVPAAGRTGSWAEAGSRCRPSNAGRRTPAAARDIPGGPLLLKELGPLRWT
jgi:hypothetical protein